MPAVIRKGYGFDCPEPSLRETILSAAEPGKTSVRPFGQRTSMDATLVIFPNPKCSLMSLLEL